MIRRRAAWWVVIFVFLLVAVGGIAALQWWQTQQRRAAASGAAVRVTIPPGASLSRIAGELERRRLIRSALVFRWLGRAVRITPGIYDIRPSEPPAEILRRLEKGDVATVRVTFPEGFTVRQIATRLEKNGLASPATFVDFATRHGSDLNAPFPLPDNLEGYLFPATYRFPIGASETQIAQQMVQAFADKVEKIAPGAAVADTAARQRLIIVASLIEREAKVPQDRARIAGVIYNRLEKNMRLDIDATVQYARLQNGLDYKSRLLFRDLEIASPYNTYKINGLPPGPICCPGEAALQAAAQPDRHPYLYYVARSDGSHLFGRTLAEHQRNITVARRRGG